MHAWGDGFELLRNPPGQSTELFHSLHIYNRLGQYEMLNRLTGWPGLWSFIAINRIATVHLDRSNVISLLSTLAYHYSIDYRIAPPPPSPLCFENSTLFISGFFHQVLLNSTTASNYFSPHSPGAALNVNCRHSRLYPSEHETFVYHLYNV